MFNTQILRLMGADGVAVIVTRWFGGTLLGPDRFRLINNCARRMLEIQAPDCISVDVKSDNKASSKHGNNGRKYTKSKKR